ncbi:MAG: choice-of-anchor E domain-containing protein, partial [Candidatus Eisenbacteria bacterium]|nr:choice-of-anchor E domain-containing protein [Candidatus Eisenbacteria bacterium]
MRHRNAALLAFGVLALAQPTRAATVQYTDVLPLTTTNWADVASVPKFDPGLGVLTSVTLELAGHVEGSAAFESLDAQAATVTMNLAAEIEIQRPDLSTLVTVLPLATTVDNVDAFDGVIDFAGASGRSYDDLAGDDTDAFYTTAPGDLALFTGQGMIDLPAIATGASSGSGAGNLILQFGTSASAEVPQW